jgi:hypothetical protein
MGFGKSREHYSDPETVRMVRQREAKYPETQDAPVLHLAAKIGTTHGSFMRPVARLRGQRRTERTPPGRAA